MSTVQLTDYDLVRQFIDGDESSIEVLIKRHKSKVYTYILMLVKNQELAEDIFQDTFIKVVKSLRLNRYKDDGRFIGWVLRIAHNLVIDHFRRQKNMRTISNTDGKVDLFNNAKFSDSTIEDHMISDQIRKKVKSLIDYLPEEQKEVVIMRHYMDLSFKEIANLTDVSINTALGRMRYALINMRKLIENNSIQVS
ncbi:MAG: sigma-70 family RNA polymerase sigma factor [Salinivirgaceae bacterium]|nr:sigma-70 family RNA polymerase sigma factor [Salinivirgaceae bacterium]MDD4745696.1 sigma-70 family RNA polymerase sigma factor [Salinivirgaceae bacterium]MDY0279661.1 sigma-70 family RNA polymerase sigma factor [Salinivirgaceae bacterium]